ncbi:MAG: polyprenyl synthetase family protein [Actinomycetota bacterium]|nr:polyprenyl synthetase family protein [Actinomycetota bacterium]
MFDTDRVGLPLGDAGVEADLRTGLAAVEQLLRDAVKSDYPFVTETSRHLVDAGGKRYRPLLVLLAAQFGDRNAPGIVPAAAVVELTHLATLYHDDVMDEAALRRGAVSANARWTNTVAILTGDFLFARASDILADLGPDAVRLQARTFERLVTGQIRETVGPAPGDDEVEHYLSVVIDKTASLLATSARFGAMLSGADDQTVDVLTRFGERFGVAFQLSDDVLDVASESTQSGKEPGTDLREGIRTLPVLHARRSRDAADTRLLELLDGDLTDERLRAEALALLRAHPAMRVARSDVQRWADDAKSVLAPLPEVPAKSTLLAICDAVVSRTA